MPEQISGEWKVIFKRLTEQYPESHKMLQEFREKTYDIWKNISPNWGEKIDGFFGIHKDGKLKGNEPFYLMLISLIEIIMEEMKKENKKQLFELLKKHVPDISLPKICSKCGIENDENAKYCDQCGEQLPTNEVEND